jgi:hypothetical protein
MLSIRSRINFLIRFLDFAGKACVSEKPER